jgi:hypothetical protein
MQDSHALASLGFRPTTLFEGFPYLVTRVVQTMYHVIVLPDDIDVPLVEVARLQARANALPTCLVCAADSAVYIGADRCEHQGEPPRGGVIVTGRLRPCRVFTETASLVSRRSALDRFIDQVTPRKEYMFGDLTKGGQPATLEETVMLAGTQANGVPRGLARCPQCGEWRGRCLDPSPQFAGQVMEVHCRCANNNRCAACGGLLHTRKLNANQYREADGQIWHTPGFSAFGHRCVRNESGTSRPDSAAGGTTDRLSGA